MKGNQAEKCFTKIMCNLTGCSEAHQINEGSLSEVPGPEYDS